MRELEGKRAPVRALAIGPTGRFVLAPTESEQPALWDLEGGSPEVIFPHDKSAFRAAAWSPDGELVALSRPSFVWVVTSQGGGIASIPCQGLPQSLDWSADSKMLVIAGGGGPVKVWRRSDQGAKDLPQRPDIAVFAGPGRLCLFTDRRIEFVPAEGGTPVLVHQHFLRNVFSLAWSEKARMLVEGDSGLNLYSADGKAGTKVPMSTPLTMPVLSWSPDGGTLVAFAHLQLVDHKGRLGKQLTTDNAFDAAWSPDGQRVAAFSPDPPRPIRIYRLDGGLESSFEGTAPLAWGREKEAQLAYFDVGKGKMVLRPSGESFDLDKRMGSAFHAAWGPNGLLVAQEKALGRRDGPKFPFRTLFGWAAPLVPRKLCSRPDGDGEFAVVLGGDLRVFGPNAIERKKYGPFTSPINGTCYSPDGKWLAVGCQDGQVFFHGEGKLRPMPGRGGIGFDVAWGRRGLLAQGLADGVVRVSEPLADGPRFRWAMVNLPECTYTFAPDGRVISGPARRERDLIYLVEQEDGELRLVTPEEFARLRDG
jgi:WD40 repeat protein